jgi:two-component system, cell cycle sensor histidine kinase and response regulator CckA
VSRKTDGRYSGLFQNMLDGFAVHEIILDDSGEPRDYRFLDVNPAFEQLMGLQAADIIGRTAREVNLYIEPVWLCTYGQVARTGVPVRFEQYSGSIGKWFEVGIFRPLPGQFACILKDITEQRRAEDSHRLYEARLESLVRITRHSSGDESELLELALEEAISLTASAIGYIYTYNEETQELTLVSWSRGKAAGRRASQNKSAYKLEETGLWGEAVRQRKPVVVNEYDAAFVPRQDLPDGHLPLSRFLTLPLTSRGRIVAVIGVANKEAPYDEGDVRQLGLLMDAAWKIVELKQAEMGLRQSEFTLRAVFSAMTDVVIVLDQDGRYREIAPGGQALLSRPASELLGRTLEEVLPPERAALIRGAIRETLRTRAPNTVEYSREAEGRVRWYSATVSPMTAQSVILVAREITAAKQAEGTLRESEETLRSVFEAAPEAMLIMGEDGRVVMANRAACGHLAYQREKLIGLEGRRIFSAAQIADPAAWPPGRFPVEGFLPGRCRQGSGAEIPVELAAVPLTLRGTRALLCVARDISGRLAAESRIGFQARLLEEVGQAVIAADLSGAITYWNKAAADMYGWTREEALGRSVGELLYRDTQEAASGVVDALSIGSRELPARHRTGRVFPVQVSNTPVYDDSGAQIGVIGVSFDLTERRKAEEDLMVSEERFRQAQKMEAVGRLAGGVAHDFNNLLTVIKGYCDIAASRAGPDSAVRSDLAEIQHAADRAVGLTSQLLAFSRKQVMQPRIISMGALVDGLRSMLQRLLGEDIEVVMHLPADPLSVRADPGRLEQAIMNLAVNARDAMPGGGVLKLEVSHARMEREYAERNPGAREGEYVMLAVSDTGCGMDKEVQEHLFEPFFTTKEKGKGTGLGLATVYGIVKQSDGFVLCYSEPGKGTSFKIYLPRTADAGTEKGTAPALPAVSGGTESILLVEDDPAVRGLTMAVLQKAGYAVEAAQNGAEAMNMLGTNGHRVELLITDMVMPGMDGRKVAAEVQARVPGVKVLFVSGYAENATLHQGGLRKDVNFIQKPFSSADFLARVRAILDARG